MLLDRRTLRAAMGLMAGAVMGLTVGAILAWLPLQRDRGYFPDLASEISSPERRHDSPPPRKQSPVPAKPSEANPDDPNLPIVDEVAVEKTEVCRGEDNVLTVKAHTQNGTDAFLSTEFVDPVTGRLVLGGSRIPFRLDRPVDRPLVVTIQGNMAAKTVELPAVHVKECVAPRDLIVHVKHGKAAAFDRVRLTAELVEQPPRGSARQAFVPMSPVSYEWDFGDGGKQVTANGHIDHGYEGREKNVRQSSFVIAVTAKDRHGQSVQGSTVVAFPNRAFAALTLKQRIVISLRIKEADPTTGAHEQIWLYHGHDHTVQIDGVDLIEKIRDDKGDIRETLRRTYRPQKFLGLSELPPRESSPIRDLTELEPTTPNAVRYVELHGRSTDGKDAAGGFTLLPPKRSSNARRAVATASRR